MRRIVVVGASLAGLHAAVALRRAEFDGEIALVGDEPHYPYDRPPLSKDYLAGSSTVESLRLRPAADPSETGVDWMLGRRAVSLDWDMTSGGGAAHLDDGTAVEADGVVIATGAAPRRLSGTGDLAGLHTLRSLDDADMLRSAFERGVEHLIVVGCGFIGAEVAATAREQGVEVTIVEAAPAPLTRVLDAEAGTAVADLHRGHGVDVRVGVGVAEIDAADGAVAGITLDDGTSIAGDLIVVGIGVVPETGWLEGSGLSLDNGVITDETCVAGPGIVAAGDVARWSNRRYGGALMRVEQWDNAVEMGRYAGKRLAQLAAGDPDGPPEPFEPVPWFWSDQYDRKMQLAGFAGVDAEMVQGSFAEQRFVRLYFDETGAPTGAFCWNRPRQAIMARQMLAAGAGPDEFRDALS